MIGNDIVDLNQASIDSNWQRPRFLDKIFSSKEQEYIYNSKNSFKTVWRLWSMKESAYKIHARHHRKRVFNPKALLCSILNDTEGSVNIVDKYYYTTSIVENNFILTTATSNLKNNMTTSCFSVRSNDYKTLSSLCYDYLKQDVASTIGVEKTSLSIQKDHIGAPKLYCDDMHINMPFSITHHGNYGAYALFES